MPCKNIPLRSSCFAEASQDKSSFEGQAKNPFSKNMQPEYDLEKIKFSIDEGTWGRAVDLYEGGKIRNFKDYPQGYDAIVSGTHDYQVFVSAKKYDIGSCTCYLGQNETLCKHMVALAIKAIVGSRRLTSEEKILDNKVVCSGIKGKLSKTDLMSTKKEITSALRYIKPYNGPSRIWFQYQDSLIEGCNRLAKIVSGLPVSSKTAKLLIDLLLRLDRKLSTGGVDDSDGTVGNFIDDVVGILKKYVSLEPDCKQTFQVLKNKKTCFGWEDPLLKMKNNANRTAD
jgi:hypothetical protein